MNKNLILTSLTTPKLTNSTQISLGAHLRLLNSKPDTGLQLVMYYFSSNSFTSQAGSFFPPGFDAPSPGALNSSPHVSYFIFIPLSDHPPWTPQTLANGTHLNSFPIPNLYQEANRIFPPMDIRVVWRHGRPCVLVVSLLVAR